MTYFRSLSISLVFIALGSAVSIGSANDAVATNVTMVSAFLACIFTVVDVIDTLMSKFINRNKPDGVVGIDSPTSLKNREDIDNITKFLDGTFDDMSQRVKLNLETNSKNTRDIEALSKTVDKLQGEVSNILLANGFKVLK